MALNLLFLGFTGLIPFTSDLLARYGDQPVAVICYAAVIAGASLMSWAMMAQARRRDFVKTSARELASPYGTARALVLPGVFVASGISQPDTCRVSLGGEFLRQPGSWCREKEEPRFRSQFPDPEPVSRLGLRLPALLASTMT